MEDGERYCLLVDSSSGVPLYYPNLYVTTQVRNRSRSLAAMQGALGGIQGLLRFMAQRNEDLEARFAAKEYLAAGELDAIRDHCQRRIRSLASGVDVPPRRYRVATRVERVAKETEYARLTSIALYVDWLAYALLGGRVGKESRLQIERMVNGLRSRRPTRTGRAGTDTEKGLTEQQVATAFEVFRPDSELNPFQDHAVRVRNRLIFLLLYYLGLRGGELLNIRCRDIDFQSNTLFVARRPDERDDPRTDQPLVKTQDRRLPLKDTLIQQLHGYIRDERRSVPNTSRHDFLFVTHKSGPTQGQPLSKSAYKRVIQLVRTAAPALCAMTGHQLRHTWNENFSKHLDRMDRPPKPEEQEQMRSYLMGWKAGSGTAAVYNRRYIRSKAQEASVGLQEGTIRLPKGKAIGEDQVS